MNSLDLDDKHFSVYRSETDKFGSDISSIFNIDQKDLRLESSRNKDENREEMKQSEQNQTEVSNSLQQKETLINVNQI